MWQIAEMSVIGALSSCSILAVNTGSTALDAIAQLGIGGFGLYLMYKVVSSSVAELATRIESLEKNIYDLVKQNTELILILKDGTLTAKAQNELLAAIAAADERQELIVKDIQSDLHHIKERQVDILTASLRAKETSDTEKTKLVASMKEDKSPSQQARKDSSKELKK